MSCINLNNIDECKACQGRAYLPVCCKTRELIYPDGFNIPLSIDACCGDWDYEMCPECKSGYVLKKA
jgi:hypothetical protein